MKQKLGALLRPRSTSRGSCSWTSRRSAWTRSPGATSGSSCTRWSRSGVTVIVSTAYMDEAERFDRLAFLRDGRAARARHPGARSGSRSADGCSQSARSRCGRPGTRLEGLAAVRRASVFGDRLHVAVDSARRRALGARRAARGVGIDSVEVHPVEPSMEDVFIETASPRPKREGRMEAELAVAARRSPGGSATSPPSTPSRSRSRGERSSDSSGPTARARRRRSRC
jgi:hypothetical protein